MMTSLKKGFTLIELLVVITIIGILATGAVTTFTSQIQKARDTTRTSDIKALQGAIEQAYQDRGEYPDRGGLTNTGATGAPITPYMTTFPEDPKSGQARTASANPADSGAAFDYLYNVSQDENGISRQEYEVSTTFEQSGNITTKAINAADNGDDGGRYEAGINVDDSEHFTVRTALIGTAATDQCVGVTGNANTTCNANRPTVIRKN